MVRTGLAIAIPVGTYARIAPRSIFAVKQSIDVGVGVVDADYRGDLGVDPINNSDDKFGSSKGAGLPSSSSKRLVHLRWRR